MVHIHISRDQPGEGETVCHDPQIRIPQMESLRDVSILSSNSSSQNERARECEGEGGTGGG